MTWRQHAHLVILSLCLSVFLAGPSWAIECAPYARYISGIELYGNAGSWWWSAEGRYARGHQPKIGAALVFKPLDRMPDGHVAVVAQVLNRRAVKVDHANWGSGGGMRGSVERNILVIDVSPRNDWSQVRVWYPPTRDIGTHVYPVYGFIYAAGPAPRLQRAAFRTSRHRHHVHAVTASLG